MTTLLTKIVADFSTSLAVKMAIGATTGTLQSSTDSDGVALPTGNYCLTIDGDNSKKEYIFCALSGTALTSIKTISRQGVQSSGCVREHRVGAKVEITDFGTIKYHDDLLKGTTGFDASTPIKYDGEPSFTYGNHEITTWDKAKDYADSLSYAGAPDANTTTKGIIEIATEAQTLAGTDTGETSAYLSVLPSQIAKNIQNSVYNYVADAEASDTYVITLVPAISDYATGQVFYFKANTANTGAATLNVNAKGAKTIKKNHDQDLEDGDIEAGSIVQVVYDGTNFQMLNQQATMPTSALLSESATFFGSTDITGAQAETLSDGSNADLLHTHITSASGVMTEVNVNTSQTIDRTINCGFQPTTIILNYWIQGHTANSGTNIYKKYAGIATFNGTTMTCNYFLGYLGDGSDNTAVTANSMLEPGSSEEIKAGAAGAGNAGEAEIKVTINSVSATGFVIRNVISEYGTGPATRAKIAWTAFK